MTGFIIQHQIDFTYKFDFWIKLESNPASDEKVTNIYSISKKSV